MAQLSDDCFAFGGPMLSVEAAVELLAARLHIVEERESVSLSAADGRVLAQDLQAPLPLPPFTNSAVDGYAVRAADTGLEVIYDGIRVTPEQLVKTVQEKKVHILGLSILSGSHVPLIREVMQRLRAAGFQRFDGERQVFKTRYFRAGGTKKLLRRIIARGACAHRDFV